MTVQFQYDKEKALAVLGFLASQGIQELSKHKICKLVFLADKYHLVRYGRPITGDTYFAIEHGPIPSVIKNGLDSLEAGKECEFTSYFELNRNYRYPWVSSKSKFDFSSLSESDIDALKRVVELFASMNFFELRAITHGMPAYKKAWEHRGKKKSARMTFEDFFEEEPQAISGAFEDMKENYSLSKRFVCI